MLLFSLAVALPFLFASVYGLAVAIVLIRTNKPKQAFLWAIVVGLVGGAVGPGLLSASVLTSDTFVSGLPSQPWLGPWTTFTTFVMIPFLSMAVATLGTRALAVRRARRLSQS